MENYHYIKVEKALIYFQKNYINQPSLEEVASHVHLSTYHFSRIFKRWAGITPKKFLQFLTFEEAKKRLKENLSIEKTALSTGLSSSSRLYDLFVNFEGITPGEYKNTGKNLTIYYAMHESPFGYYFLAVTDRGICNLTFTKKLDLILDNIRDEWPNATFHYSYKKTKDIADKLFKCSLKNGNKLTLLVKGNKYQIKIWEALLNIPFGSLVTYEKIAEHLEIDLDINSLEQVLLDNPIRYLIPCHRVIKDLTNQGEFQWGNPRMLTIIGWEASKKQQKSNLIYKKL